MSARARSDSKTSRRYLGTNTTQPSQAVSARAISSHCCQTHTTSRIKAYNITVSLRRLLPHRIHYARHPVSYNISIHHTWRVAVTTTVRRNQCHKKQPLRARSAAVRKLHRMQRQWLPRTQLRQERARMCHHYERRASPSKCSSSEVTVTHNIHRAVTRRGRLARAALEVTYNSLRRTAAATACWQD